ncbi:hypothetical protein [Nocardia sp. NPDC004722]
MTTADPTYGGALRVLVDILRRYDSLEDFLRQLLRELDAPSHVLPRLVLRAPGPRHALVTDTGIEAPTS